MAKTRTFNGKTYRFAQTIKMKTEAQKRAEELRSRGRSVRITKSRLGYKLWFRD